MPGALYRCTPDSRLTMHALTQGIADLIGFAAGDFIDNHVRSYAEVIHPDDREQVIARLRAVLEQAAAQPEQLEYRVLTADGRERWLQQKAWVARDAQGL